MQDLYNAVPKPSPVISVDCMYINEEGLSIIKKFEGCKLKAYKDQGGVWSIGYGSTLNVTPGMEITQDQANKLLQRDISNFEKEVSSCLKNTVNCNEFSALVCFTYNIGITNFLRSRMYYMINMDDKLMASKEFVKWKYIDGKESDGLLNRRKAEQNLFLKPISDKK